MDTRTAPFFRTLLLAAATMLFFAANSLLARLALREGEIDAASFTAVRIGSGAAALALLAGSRRGPGVLGEHGSWASAFALFGYAVAFSFAYLSLSAGVGALILFAAVQITMIGFGMVRGEHPRPAEWLGLAMALAGLVYLVSPGLTAPSLSGAMLMTASGIAWGAYSLAARGVRSPTAATAGNFVRAAPLAGLLAFGAGVAGEPHASWIGLALAVLSGAVTSGLGYAIWYRVARNLSAARAAIVQLTVPIIAALAGVVFLGEHLTWRLMLASGAILGGVALALVGGGASASAQN